MRNLCIRSVFTRKASPSYKTLLLMTRESRANLPVLYAMLLSASASTQIFLISSINKQCHTLVLLTLSPSVEGQVLFVLRPRGATPLHNKVGQGTTPRTDCMHLLLRPRAAKRKVHCQAALRAVERNSRLNSLPNRPRQWCSI